MFLDDPRCSLWSSATSISDGILLQGGRAKSEWMKQLVIGAKTDLPPQINSIGKETKFSRVLGLSVFDFTL